MLARTFWTVVGTLVLVGAHYASEVNQAKVLVVTHGDRVNISDHVVRGKVTIFDFYSEYCPPCRRIAGPLEKLVNGNPKLLLRKVDLNRPGVKGIDWRSPVARQYGISGVPYFIMFDEQGKVTHKGDEAMELLIKWLVERGLIRE
ncbi:MAG: thioredoxin family protein [Candidatus Riflebacteria bacterium]|nr:thioredoxin family protein [Candidatus Riflebacteria bacterium]